MVELGSPSIMLRGGFTKRSLEAGTEVSIVRVSGHGESKANGSSVTFSDGKRRASSLFPLQRQAKIP
jgi:hypothetical protein